MKRDIDKKTQKKRNTVNKNDKKNTYSKKKVIKKDLLEDNHKNVKRKKQDKVVITVLSCFIVFLVIVLVIINKTSYYNSKEYSFDYLRFSATNYVKREGILNSITSKDDSCYISYYSKINNDDISIDLGGFEKINDHEWLKQEFENGVTWASYYKDSFYIVQMYSKDEDTYNNECKKDFEKIKETFSFMKAE